jgi:hypothetical protein
VAEEARRIGLIEAAAPDPGAVMAAFRLPGTPVAMTPAAGASPVGPGGRVSSAPTEPQKASYRPVPVEIALGVETLLNV